MKTLSTIKNSLSAAAIASILMLSTIQPSSASIPDVCGNLAEELARQEAFVNELTQAKTHIYARMTEIAQIGIAMRNGKEYPKAHIDQLLRERSILATQYNHIYFTLLKANAEFTALEGEYHAKCAFFDDNPFDNDGSENGSEEVVADETTDPDASVE